MNKFGGFFARRAGLYDKPADPTPNATPPTDNPLELDEELFTALGAQLGGENESLRNLLLDANAKIGELDGIKNAVGKLVDPVSKALRAFEAEKSEKISLQTVLNNTRTAYGKLRNEVAELEKKANLSEKECLALRQELTTTQNLLRTLEATKAEIAIDIAARRAQIVDLEARLAQETGEGKALREENRRLDERFSAADKRVMALESELNGARQRLLMLEDEKRAQQISLDKISAESARLSRKLAETEANLTATQGRLRHVDGTVAELNTERARLVSALDEANERHEHELTTQRMRFDALQARASASEKLLGEAREHLLARADEIRTYDRRAGELALERDALQARVADLEAEPFNSANDGLWTRGLLIRRRIADGDLAFFTTWCPAGTSIETLVAVEGHRWAIEDSFETAKNEFGLDHNESRSWHGWHRHVSLVMLAFAMMAAVRYRANSVPPLKTKGRAQRAAA